MNNGILSEENLSLTQSVANNNRARALQRAAARALLNGHLDALAAISPPEQTSHKFPFGQYEGRTPQQIAIVDKGYLKWVLGTNIPKRFPDLGSDIKSALSETA